jgi:hypothetical protein
MSLYNTVLCRGFVLDMGTVKIPLVACLMGYLWGSEETPGGMSYLWVSELDVI